jgi:dUTP pyrophosphatase
VSSPYISSYPEIGVYKLDPRVRTPERANEFAIGIDIFAFMLSESGRAITRPCHQKGVTAIPTGLVLQPPDGYYIQIHSRSGLAKKGLFVANAPGIVDPDFSGEIFILLFNGSYETHYVQHDHRIAQLTLAPIHRASILDCPGRPRPYGRGAEGYGSTGL